MRAKKEKWPVSTFNEDEKQRMIVINKDFFLFPLSKNEVMLFCYRIALENKRNSQESKRPSGGSESGPRNLFFKLQNEEQRQPPLQKRNKKIIVKHIKTCA